MLMIVAFIVLWQVLEQNGYLEFAPASGTVQLDLNVPTLSTCETGGEPTCPPGNTCCADEACAAGFRASSRAPQRWPSCTAVPAGGAAQQTACFAQCRGPPCIPSDTRAHSAAEAVGGGVCYTSFTPLQDLRYCTQSGRMQRTTQSGLTVPNQNCTFADGLEASVVHGSSILLGTHIEVFDQVRHATPQVPGGYGAGCGCADEQDASSCLQRAPNASGDFSCPAIWHTQNRTNTFVADIERFTLSIRHTVYQTLLGFESTSHTMFGWLQVGALNDYTRLSASQRQKQDALCRTAPSAREVSYNGTGALTEHAPCLILPNRTLGGIDFFELRTLLDAVGVSLEEIADEGQTNRATGVGGIDDTARGSGAVMLLSVVYANSRPFHGLSRAKDPENHGGISYVYRLSFLNDTAKETFAHWAPYPQRRLLTNMNGILIYAQPSGVLARFSYTVLIVTLTTSLAFLAVAQTIVKFCAERVLRQRHYYTAQMYERSVDFSGLDEEQKELEKLSTTSLRDECRSRGLVSEGSKPLLTLRIVEDIQRQAADAEGSADEFSSPSNFSVLAFFGACWRWCRGGVHSVRQGARASRHLAAKTLFRQQLGSRTRLAT